MDTTTPSIESLFAQLGLPNGQQHIDKFVEQHWLEASISLSDAPFWTDSQKHFIEESLREDGAWSEVIDELDSMLR
ncbi:DUF2789 family protein [Pseudoalteromonas xiamenensis]|uniref:DUF2789 domain-containing protein n=1 Tax=Pseudoalteromonas xiamenensis TaxID=882626 RepID=A0A975DJD4_9GAMM|nr:DUF2789 family protein [Pseudoalteromonas xiamenensis]QTH71376.1 DUF2789 domain-containing protein [Pseudoalteromonas xiamenensis]WMN59754.1 DUF2789 domain-containing protein [Pseudoalteromonas xiamenensis]